MATDPTNEDGMMDDDVPMGTDPATGERVDDQRAGGASNLASPTGTRGTDEDDSEDAAGAQGGRGPAPAGSGAAAGEPS